MTVNRLKNNLCGISRLEIKRAELKLLFFPLSIETFTKHRPLCSRCRPWWTSGSRRCPPWPSTPPPGWGTGQSGSSWWSRLRRLCRSQSCTWAAGHGLTGPCWRWSSPPSWGGKISGQSGVSSLCLTLPNCSRITSGSILMILSNTSSSYKT